MVAWKMMTMGEKASRRTFHCRYQLSFVFFIITGSFGLAIRRLSLTLGYQVQHIGREYGFVQTLTISLTRRHRIGTALTYIP
jgi:hypothetical protein